MSTATRGGQLGAMLKYSGHDGLIIDGEADTPVYIFINDDKISIEDASALSGRAPASHRGSV